MIDHLDREYGLSREDAYVLCSLCVDLKISEIVDAGEWIVSALLPEAVFRTDSGGMQRPALAPALSWSPRGRRCAGPGSAA